MKKTFRMALALALACTTLTYTSCTKDYSDEINNLGKDIENLQTKHDQDIAALKNDIQSVKTSISSLESAYKSADEALKSDIKSNADAIKALQSEVAKKADLSDVNSKLAAIEEKLASKADVTALNKAVADLKSDLEKKISDLDKALRDVIKALDGRVEKLEEAVKACNDAQAALSNELKSLVVVPQLYYGGVEAVSYSYLAANTQKAVKALGTEAGVTSEEGAAAKWEKDAIISYEKVKNVSVAELATAEYHMNPSTFAGVDKASWTLNGYDKEYKTKATSDAEVKVWKPVVKAVEAKEGDAVVSYVIENAELLNPAEKISVMNLTATVAEGKTVDSDYAAVVLSNVNLKSLAFTKDSKWNTVNECNVVAENKNELYNTAADAVKNAPSVKVTYNKGAYNLKKDLNLHYLDGNDEKNMTLAAFEAKYPGVAISFSLVPYTLGGNVTLESAFGSVDAATGDFTPMYWDNSAKKSVPCGVDTEEGISAVGREPVVLVTVTYGDDVILGQYFKIKIVKDPVVNPDPITITLEPFDKLPYICDEQKNTTTWKQFTFNILEALKLDYKEFVSAYTWDEKTYVMGKKGLVESTDYGTVVYLKDNAGSAINDAFVWTINNTNAKAILKAGGEVSVYTGFLNKATNQVVYVEFVGGVHPAAAFDFGANKINNEWFDDVNAEALNTARINVLVPNATTDDVTNFTRDLTHFFVGYKPSCELTAESKAVYDKLKLEPESTFAFADAQPCQLAKFVLSKDKLNLYKEKVDADSLVANITPEGVVTYATTDVAKELLNKYGLYVSKDGVTDYNQVNKVQDQILFANVQVTTTYGECEIPAGTANFHVRFVRPLTIDFADLATDSEESAVTGYNIYLKDAISGIVDWNKQAVIKDGEANIINGVNMYQYYQISKLNVDIENAERDNWDTKDPAKWGKISTVTPDAQIKLGTVTVDKTTGVVTFTEANSPIDISDFASLQNVVINYKNDRAVVDSFKVKVGLTIEYAWGSYPADVIITIKPTKDTSAN
ncbi:MAG: hypothetical protein MR330_04550 [Rikenellaceae bacterium]|nr:hypothetical protein [Rikenellaceae bacterium]